jgi:hypothetical protein
VIRPGSWPVSKVKLGVKYYKNVTEFRDNILLNKEQVNRKRPGNGIDRE